MLYKWKAGWLVYEILRATLSAQCLRNSNKNASFSIIHTLVVISMNTILSAMFTTVNCFSWHETIQWSDRLSDMNCKNFFQTLTSEMFVPLQMYFEFKFNFFFNLIYVPVHFIISFYRNTWKNVYGFLLVQKHAVSQILKRSIYKVSLSHKSWLMRLWNRLNTWVHPGSVASTLTFGLGCGHSLGIRSNCELCRLCVLSLHNEVGGVRQYTRKR